MVQATSDVLWSLPVVRSDLTKQDQMLSVMWLQRKQCAAISYGQPLYLLKRKYCNRFRWRSCKRGVRLRNRETGWRIKRLWFVSHVLTSSPARPRCRSPGSAPNKSQKSADERQEEPASEEGPGPLPFSSDAAGVPAAAPLRWRCQPPGSGCPAATSQTAARSPSRWWSPSARSPEGRRLSDLISFSQFKVSLL